MRNLILLLVVFGGVAGAATRTITLAADKNFSSTTTTDWGGTKPVNGDNIVVNSSGGVNYTLTLDTAMTFGSGQNPYYGYAASVTGGPGTSTACAGIPAIGGTAIQSIWIQCHMVSGVCTPYIGERGIYTATGTTDISSICPGSTYGLAWNAGGGAPAILAGNKATVKVAAAIVARGDVLGVATYAEYSKFVYIVPGGSITFDFSVSGANTPEYTLGMQGTGAQSPRVLASDAVNCTPATCAISTTGGGIWHYNSVFNYTILDLVNLTLTNMGDQSTTGIALQVGTSTNSEFLFKGNRVINSSCISTGTQVSTGVDFDVEWNYWTGSVPCNTYAGAQPAVLNATFASPWNGTDLRVLSNNSADLALISSSNLASVVFTNNFNRGWQQNYGGGTTYWAKFSNNVYVAHAVPNGQGIYFVIQGDADHNVIWNRDDFSNWHVVNNFTNTGAKALLWEHNIFGMSGSNTGDWGEIFGQGAWSPDHVQYNLALADASGVTWGEFFTGGTSTNSQLSVDHNYWYANSGSSPGIGFIRTDEGSKIPDLIYASVKCNVMWNNHAMANSFMHVDNMLATPTNKQTGPNFDYNYGWGGSASQTCPGCSTPQNGYAFNAQGGTPGSHDQNSLDPGYDYKRRPELFPTVYLKYTPTNGTWSSSTNYAAGNTVNDTQATYYWGQTAAFTCIATAGCPAGTPRPVSGANWYNYWEPYVWTWLEAAIPAKTTFVDGALQVDGMGEDTACTPSAPCDPTTALRHWITAGHQVTNPAFFGMCPIDGYAVGVTKTNGRNQHFRNLSIN